MVYKFNPFTNNLDLVGTSSGGAGIATLTGNSGPGAVGPDGAGNVNIVGDGTTITFTDNPGTHTLTASVTQAGIVYYSLTPYIVGSDVHSQYSTIGAAITAFNIAGVPGNIYVKPGSYTENITLPANCNLIAFENGIQSTTILVGKITATGSGASSISGFELQTNADFAIVVSGANATVLNIENCFFNCTNHTGISYTNSNVSSSIFITNCTSDLGTLGTTFFVSSSNGSITVSSSLFNNTIGSTTPSTTSQARVFLYSVFSLMPIAASGDGAYSLDNSLINTSGLNVTSISLTGVGSTFFSLSGANSGTASGISIDAGTTCSISHSLVASTNTNAITGTGTCAYTDILFSESIGFNVTTKSLQTAMTANSHLTGYQVINAVSVNHAASPYTALSTDYYISVDSSGGAVTIKLPNAPITNRIFVVKDSTGSAVAHNITVTTVGGAVTIDGSTSYVMATNYQAINLRFNGTSYEVF